MGYYPRLKDLKEDKDFSIRKLADLLHIQKTIYHNYETGKRELSSHFIYLFLVRRSQSFLTTPLTIPASWNSSLPCKYPTLFLHLHVP